MKKLSEASKLLLKLLVVVVVVVVLRLIRGAAHPLPSSVLGTTMVLFISPSAAFLIHPAGSSSLSPLFLSLLRLVEMDGRHVHESLAELQEC